MLGIENRETILKIELFLMQLPRKEESTSWTQEVKPSIPSCLLSFPLHESRPQVPEDNECKHS